MKHFRSEERKDNKQNIYINIKQELLKCNERDSSRGRVCLDLIYLGSEGAKLSRFGSWTSNSFSQKKIESNSSAFNIVTV